MKTAELKEQECCPPFNPELWDDRIVEWNNKKFIRDRVRTFLFMPVNFGQKMRKLDNLVRRAGGTFVDNMGLSDHTSRWNMDVFLAVDKDIPGAENRSLSGRFFSKVYEGSYNDTGKWCTDFEEQASAKGLTIKKWYMWYTTCPKCAKKYGKNYVVIVGQTDG
jgi:hypothetical protein